jgi:hypothetical protein
MNCLALGLGSLDYLSVMLLSGDQIGLLGHRLLFLYIRSGPHFWATRFHSQSYVLSLTKERVGLHFGRFFNKLICFRSSRSIPSRVTRTHPLHCSTATMTFQMHQFITVGPCGPNFYISGFSCLREKIKAWGQFINWIFAPTGKVCSYWKSLHLREKFVPTGKVCAYWKSLRLREKFAPTGKVCAYWKNLHLATVGT